jgi:hypothetical protein
MILGLSHIAFGTRDIERATARLAGFGYGLRFDLPALENHIAKAPMLSRHQPLHHLRALVAPGVMAIELLDHGSFAGGWQTTAFVAIFRCAEPPADWQPRDETALPLADEAWPRLENALGQRPLVAYDPALQMTLLWIRSDDAPGLFACAMPTEDIEALEAVLAALRFRAAPTGLWSLLTPLPVLQAHMVPVPYRAHDDWRANAPLDARGCVCLALMARGNAAPPSHLQGESATFDLTVNNKPSTITMIRTKHGPVIELVEQKT